jgi:hypothetical protein
MIQKVKACAAVPLMINIFTFLIRNNIIDGLFLVPPDLELVVLHILAQGPVPDELLEYSSNANTNSAEKSAEY